MTLATYKRIDFPFMLAMALYGEGRSYKEIAFVTKSSECTVYNYLKELKIVRGRRDRKVRSCAIARCKKPYHGRGLCQYHYKRLYDRRHPNGQVVRV